MNDRSFNNAAATPLLGGNLNGMGVNTFGAFNSFDRPLPSETLDLVEYWRSITKRKWSIVGLAILVALLTTLVVFSLRPSYRATATVMIDRKSTRLNSSHG